MNKDTAGQMYTLEESKTVIFYYYAQLKMWTKNKKKKKEKIKEDSF